MSVPYKNVHPLHPVRCEVKVLSLSKSMQDSGWTGDPLLVIYRLGRLFAANGTHRIAAAQATKTPLKTFVVHAPVNETARVTHLLNELLHPDVTDKARYAALLELRKTGTVPEEAVRIMKEELDKHGGF